LLVVSYSSSGAKRIVVVRVNATSITSAIAGIKGCKVGFYRAGCSVVCRVSCKVASCVS
jgi:hypothetical protein